MSSVAISKHLVDMRVLFDAALGEPVDGTVAEKGAAAVDLEMLERRLPALRHRIIKALAEVPAEELGESSVAAALSTLLRISRKEAHRRVKEAAELGPRSAMTGEPLDPLRCTTAAAQLRGDIGFEHVKIIVKFFKRLPHFVDHETREAAEAQLAELACGLRPEELGKAAERLALILDQDGNLSNPDQRARSWLRTGRQKPDGMTSIHGELDPEANALWEAVQAKWAAPGMCNPDDDAPGVDDEPAPDAVAKDARSTGQRNHDAFKAVLRAMLASGKLGSHKGLPVTVVASTTVQELQSAAGHAVTGGGSLLPMADLIRMASHAYHYLAIFDEHTQEALYLGRTKRFASKAQRIVLYARDRGCTFPGCTAPAYHSEVHHRDRDWARGGKTDINDETLACGIDNRRVKPGGWRTRKRADGRTEWLPPPNLDTGQARVNNYHHPERYLIGDEHDSRHSRDDDDDKP